MINCPYCGKLTDPKLQNCPHCGGYLQKQSKAPSAEEKPSRTAGQRCPNCGASVNDGDIICVACGTNLLTGQKIAEEARQEVAKARRGNLLWIMGAVGVAVILIAGAMAVYLMTQDPVQKAVQLSRQNNFLEATNVLVKHLDKHPDDAQAHFLLGKVYWKTTQFLNAASAFEKTVRLDPQNPQAGLMAVLCLASVTDQSTWPRQVAVLRDVVKAFPQNVQAAHLLGLALGAQGNVDGQVEALKKVVELNPGHGSAHENLGMALALQHAYADAERELNVARNQGVNTGEIAAVQGFVAYLHGQDEVALAKLAAALEEDSSIRKEVLTRLGLILVSQGRFNEATPYLKEVVDMGGQTRVARFFHAICLVARGATTEALRQFENLGQQRGPLAVEANIQAAHLYLEQNDTEHALEAVELAASFGGGGAVLDTLRGRVEARAGQTRQAQNAFKRAIQADPSYAPAHLENGLAYVKREVFTEGVRELERYLSLVDPQEEGARAAEVRALVEQLKQTLGKKEPLTATTAAISEGRSS